MLILVLLPVVAIGLFLATMASLVLARRAADHRAQRAMVPCAGCAQPIQPMALTCPACRQANPSPRRVGLLGQATARPVTDPATHRLELAARKRCPVCASRLPAFSLQQPCPACSTVTFADPAAVTIYLTWLARRLPVTLAVSFLCGLIPLVGIVPAVTFFAST